MWFAYGMSRTRLVVSLPFAAAGLLLAGCASTPRARSVEATYRFDGVRRGTGFDEWPAIRGVLERHSATPIRESRERPKAIGSAELSTYTVQVTLPNMAEADAINTELDDLASQRLGGSRVEFGLTETLFRFRSNAVAAAVNLYVSGFATEGCTVRLFPDPEADPIIVRAGRAGMWNTKLPSAPVDGWLYGLSEDPAGKLRTRYFRVNVSTQRQEQVEEAEFQRMFPKSLPPKKQ